MSHECQGRQWDGPCGELEQLTNTLRRVRHFLDFSVRAWLPNEHTNCGIDSGCAHGAMERDMFNELDACVLDITRNLGE